MGFRRDRFVLIAALIVLLGAGASWATCPVDFVPISQCLADGIILMGDPLADAGGAWWILGAGDPAIGVGMDSGGLTSPSVDPISGWIADFFGPPADTRCFLWDWNQNQAGSDGCPAPADASKVMVTLLTDSADNYAFMAVAGDGSGFNYDMINNGVANPFFGGGVAGVPLLPIPAPVILSQVVLGSDVEVTVDVPPAVNAYDDIGGGRDTIYSYSLTDDGVVIGSGAGTYTVGGGSNLCWDIGTGDGFVATGCVLVSNCPDNTDSDSDGVLECIDNCPSTPNPGQEDDDQDGLGNACDTCPLDPDNDVDLDGICGDVDNCPVDANANQRDQDSDGWGNACDCLRNNPDIFAIPSDVTNVVLSGDAMSWDSAQATGGNNTFHDVARGFLAELVTGSGAGDVCLGSSIAPATLDDFTLPPPGEMYWYLIRGRNNCGNGPYGFDSVGTARTTLACPE